MSACLLKACSVGTTELGRPLCKSHWFSLPASYRVALRSASNRHRRDPSELNAARLQVVVNKAEYYLKERASA